MTSEEFGDIMDEYYMQVETKFFRGHIDEDKYDRLAVKLYEWMRFFKSLPSMREAD